MLYFLVSTLSCPFPAGCQASFAVEQGFMTIIGKMISSKHCCNFHQRFSFPEELLDAENCRVLLNGGVLTVWVEGEQDFVGEQQQQSQHCTNWCSPVWTHTHFLATLPLLANQISPFQSHKNFIHERDLRRRAPMARHPQKH